MNKSVRFVGLDVHAESIVIAVADVGGEAATVWKSIRYDPPRLLKELRRLGPLSTLKVCYEAGPTGFGLQRFLREQKVDCSVIAPSLVPVQSGVRVKTDRRDARKLAHFLRSGDLTPIWIPDEQTEAVRDLERTREDARLAERTARQQLLKFLLRHGCRFTHGKRNWTKMHWVWIRQQRFSHEASSRVLADYVQTAEQATARVQRLTQDLNELVEDWALAPLVQSFRAFHGVDLITAVGLAAEIGNFKRFQTAGQFMAFVGLVPSEHSSGGTRRQSGITKTGNRHVRRLLVEAAWQYFNAAPGVSPALQKRRQGVLPQVVAIADKARLRLRRKSFRMQQTRKSSKKITTALARELAGFLWAAACASEAATSQTTKQAAFSPNGRGCSQHLRDNLRVSPVSAAAAR